MRLLFHWDEPEKVKKSQNILQQSKFIMVKDHDEVAAILASAHEEHCYIISTYFKTKGPGQLYEEVAPGKYKVRDAVNSAFIGGGRIYPGSAEWGSPDSRGIFDRDKPANKDEAARLLTELKTKFDEWFNSTK